MQDLGERTCDWVLCDEKNHRHKDTSMLQNIYWHELLHAKANGKQVGDRACCSNFHNSNGNLPHVFANHPWIHDRCFNSTMLSCLVTPKPTGHNLTWNFMKIFEKHWRRDRGGCEYVVLETTTNVKKDGSSWTKQGMNSFQTSAREIANNLEMATSMTWISIMFRSEHGSLQTADVRTDPHDE